MNLAKLPVRVVSPPAQRICDFLRHVDATVNESSDFIIYGSAAVSLLFADDRSEMGFTDDVDVALESPKVVDQQQVAADVVSPPLSLQYFPLTNWLVHPDWREACLDLSSLVGTESLRILIPQPLDLVISKLERAEDRDIEDCVRMVHRYELQLSPAVARLRGAAEHYPLSRRVVGQNEYSFVAVFDAPVRLQDLI